MGKYDVVVTDEDRLYPAPQLAATERALALAVADVDRLREVCRNLSVCNRLYCRNCKNDLDRILAAVDSEGAK